MPVITVVYADAEGAARSWLRSLPGFLAGRVFFGMPERPTFPLAVVQRVGRGPRGGPIDNALIQVDIFGGDHRAKGEVGALATDLQGRVESFQCGTPMGPGAVGISAGVGRGPDWRPVASSAEPRHHQARYQLDIMFSVRAV
jgi:hypothetical protein